MLSQACNATRDAFADLLESCGINVTHDIRRTLHRRVFVFIGDGSFSKSGWARGHRAFAVKQVSINQRTDNNTKDFEYFMLFC